jgi:hypothetical protein
VDCRTGSLELADANGRLVLQTQMTALPNEPARLPLSDLADGVYNLFWKTGKRGLAARVVVVKE